MDLANFISVKMANEQSIGGKQNIEFLSPQSNLGNCNTPITNLVHIQRASISSLKYRHLDISRFYTLLSLSLSSLLINRQQFIHLAAFKISPCAQECFGIVQFQIPDAFPLAQRDEVQRVLEVFHVHHFVHGPCLGSKIRWSSSMSITLSSWRNKCHEKCGENTRFW